MQKQGFDEQTPIQCRAWSILLNGQDFIGIMQNRTGLIFFILQLMIISVIYIIYIYIYIYIYI